MFFEVLKKFIDSLVKSDEENNQSKSIDDGNNIIIDRKSYKILLDKSINDYLKENHYLIAGALRNGKVASVQVYSGVGKDCKYYTSLKKLLGIKKFKDGDCTNFSKSNLIYK